jgi:transcriptional antiterminator RfaH
MFWACARTEVNRERFASGLLVQRGFAVYLPRIAECIVRRGRKVTIEKPLFVGYLFVVIETRWYDAQWCPGVNRILLGPDGVPAKVPPKVITDLKGQERNGLVQLPRNPRFKPGDPVRVTRGMFIGLRGLYQNQRPHERIAILLAVLGKVELAAADVEAG